MEKMLNMFCSLNKYQAFTFKWLLLIAYFLEFQESDTQHVKQKFRAAFCGFIVHIFLYIFHFK